MERLSGLDASFLYLESPAMPLNVCSLIICDPKDAPAPIDFQSVMMLMEQRASQMPVFRQRLVEVPMNLYHPVWVDDPDFDLIHHVRHIALPGDGGPRELGEMVGRLSSGMLDRRYPLWEVWLIEGLAGGKFAVFGKFHHAAIDGVTGAGLMAQFFDLEPKVVEHRKMPRRKGEPVPSDAELVGMALRSLSGQPRKLIKLLRKTVENAGEVIRQRSEERAEHGGGMLNAPQTHFNGPVGPRRNLAFARVDLDDIKAIRTQTGAKVNDIVLAICGGALREFLRRQDDLPDASLTAMVPVSIHGQTQAAGSNHVSGMWATLATQVEDPATRLEMIQEDTQHAKESLNAVGAEMLQDWAEFTSARAFNLAVRLYSSTGLSATAPIHNVIISNVPGPVFPLYLAGARVEAIYPIGPVFEGAGLNITLFSFAGSVDFGFMVDRDMVPEVWMLADLVVEALEDLMKAVGVKRAAKPRPRVPKSKVATKKKAVKKTSGKKRSTKKAAVKADGRKSTAKKKPSAGTKSVAKHSAKKKRATKTTGARKKNPGSGSRLGNDPLAALGEKRGG